MTKTAVRRREATQRRIRAMSHPVRREVLQHIRDKGERSPVEASWELGLDLNNVSYHVRELAKLGYLERVRTEQVRGAVKSFYVATDRHLLDTAEWDDLEPGEKEGALIDFMQPMVDDFTAAVRSGTLGHDADWIITRTPVHATDRQGFEEMREAHRELFERVTEIQAESLKRLQTTGEQPISVSSGQTCFEVESF
jgi:DNA-binding MarR family transcriptional regulator